MHYIQEAVRPAASDGSSTADVVETVTTVEIEEHRLSKYGMLHRVYIDGQLFCEHHDPESEACRKLLQRGVNGRLRIVTKGGCGTARSELNIEKGAQRRILETKRQGPVSVKRKSPPNYWRG